LNPPTPSARLASLYGTEVPAYNTLVDVSREVNQAQQDASLDQAAEKLGLRQITTD